MTRYEKEFVEKLYYITCICSAQSRSNILDILDSEVGVYILSEEGLNYFKTKHNEIP